MTAATTFQREGGLLRVSGPLLMACAMDALRRSEAEFAAGVASVDLSGVSEVDSSSLSLLMEWVRRGKGRRPGFVNPPANLVSLARLYGVLDVLQLPDNA